MKAPKHAADGAPGVRSHFGSSRRPTLWLEFPLTFLLFKVGLVEATSSFVVSMAPGANNVSKDGRLWFRASVADDAELRRPVLQALLVQLPRSQGGTESEAYVQRQSRPLLQRSTWRRYWTG